MIDQIGAIAGTAVYATMVGVLAGVPSASDRRRWTTFIAAAAWGAVVVAVAALGGFEPGATGAVPGPGLAFAALLAVLLGSWFLLPGFRAALLAVPLAALVALNVARLGGVLFLVLAADGRLSAPFASRRRSRCGTRSAPSTWSSRLLSACSPRRARRCASSPKVRGRRRWGSCHGSWSRRCWFRSISSSTLRSRRSCARRTASPPPPRPSRSDDEPLRQLSICVSPQIEMA